MNSRRPSRVALLLTLLLPVAAAAGAAAFEPGHGFQLDGLYFHVVSVSPESGALFRVAGRLPRLQVAAPDEHPGCYRVGRAFYHREACPALQAFFAATGSPADRATPARLQRQAVHGSGSHPIDYLRGTYVERAPSYGWSHVGLLYAPRSFRRGGLGGHGRYGLRGHGRGFAISLRGF